jgi:hypothetical protein
VQVAALGATLAPTLTDDVTLVVFKKGATDDAQQEELRLRRLYDRASEVEVFPPAQIVSRAWVLACEREGRRAMERPFTCAKPPPAPAHPTTGQQSTTTPTHAAATGDPPAPAALLLHRQRRTNGQRTISEVLENHDLLERVLSYLPTPGDVTRCAGVDRAFRAAAAAEAVWGPHLTRACPVAGLVHAESRSSLP